VLALQLWPFLGKQNIVDRYIYFFRHPQAHQVLNPVYRAYDGGKKVEGQKRIYS
jgi:hypothetical protein